MNISIHASAKEATQMECPNIVYYKISIHASAKEATQSNFLRSYRAALISIHASAKEATELLGYITTNKNDFNPRLREGGDII